MRTLVWFRRDLRIRDNTALHHAARASGGGVVGVFLLSPAQWEEHDDSPVKVDFWLRNLRELRLALADRNIPLIVARADSFADAPEALFDIAQRCACDTLFFNREYEVNEERRDEAVTEAFEDRDLAVRGFTDRVVLAPGEVRTNENTFYRVFTPFCKRWIEIVLERGLDVLPAPEPQAGLEIGSSQIPEAIEGFPSPEGAAELWPAGEARAIRRLEAFVESGLDAYPEARDFPAAEGTSALSPYLAAGVLSPRQCVAEAMDANRGRLSSGRRGAVAWIRELVWREFYQHVLVGFPRVSRNRPFRLETEGIEWEENDDHFLAWCEGRTGYPIVDAGMRQLVQTGWMHNRLRMITAMFLSKDLLLDWRRGERFFMRHLVDGDLGSNNGGWQWAASTGTDAAPYFRIFNPTTQSRRFDPEGAFLRKYLPELAKLDDRFLHDPSEAPEQVRARLGYPPPIVDHKAARKRAVAAFEAGG